MSSPNERPAVDAGITPCWQLNTPRSGTTEAKRSAT